MCLTRAYWPCGALQAHEVWAAAIAKALSVEDFVAASRTAIDVAVQCGRGDEAAAAEHFLLSQSCRVRRSPEIRFRSCY